MLGQERQTKEKGVSAADEMKHIHSFDDAGAYEWLDRVLPSITHSLPRGKSRRWASPSILLATVT